MRRRTTLSMTLAGCALAVGMSAAPAQAVPADKPQVLSSFTQTSAASYDAWNAARQNQAAWAAYEFDWSTDHCTQAPNNPFGFLSCPSSRPAARRHAPVRHTLPMSSRTSPTGPPVTIRRAVARDAKRLTRLVRGSGAYEGKYASAVAGYRVGPDYIEAHRAFVAVGADEQGDRVLGFYSLVLAPPELDLLFVADEAQGRGIGRLLVAHMQSEARAAGLDRVMVVSHLPAEDFYHRVGAVRTGTAPANPPAVPWDRPEFEFRIPSG